MQTETNEPSIEQHLFTDEELFAHEEASTGQRFLNYLIDALIMQYGLGMLTGYLVVTTVVAIDEETAYSLFGNQSSGSFILSTYLISIVNYLMYYTICEKLFRGYTLGKLITGTRAIRTDGQELTIRDAFLRTLSRCVPFEPFSALGNSPWHDRWTDTMVVKSR
ncbi:MAG TPA: RDD family protein [Flavisolibacter sp.]|nr:RDD family protein [Flavisolibacter sp.]